MGGYEQIQQIPSMGLLLDSNLALSYIAGLRELYNQARDDYKEFMKEYRDFYSPIASDNLAYYDLTVGAAKNLLNTYGGDLLRSAEGRAAIQNMISSVDTGRLARLKQGAENAKEYLKNRAELQSKGLWDPMLEQFRLKGKTIEDWDSEKDGMWMELSPLMKQDLNQLTSHFYDQFKKDEDLGLSTTHGNLNRFYRMKGITKQNIAAGTRAAAMGIMQSDYGQYFREMAKRQVLAANPELSGSDLEKATQQQFEYNIRQANAEKLQPTEVVDEVGLKMYEQQQQNYRALLSASKSLPSGGANPLQYSIMANLKRISGITGKLGAKDTLIVLFNDQRKADGKTVNYSQVANDLSGSMPRGMFATLAGRGNAVLGDNGKINLELSDLSKLHDASTIFNGAYSAYNDKTGKYSYFEKMPTKTIDSIKQKLTKNINDPAGIITTYNGDYVKEEVDRFKYQPTAESTGRIVSVSKRDGIHNYAEITVKNRSRYDASKKTSEQLFVDKLTGRSKYKSDLFDTYTLYYELDLRVRETDDGYCVDAVNSAGTLFPDQQAANFYKEKVKLEAQPIPGLIK